MTFQDLILALHHYWAEKGCVIHQPYDLEMGAGTFHPATFLRSLGPEPWRAAYPQPCRRPTDGRYGENPNRMQHYYQYQVVLKPAPDNIQTLLINDAEDHANPPELGTVERAMKRVKHGRYVLIPAGPNTHGHFSHFYAALWKPSCQI